MNRSIRLLSTLAIGMLALTIAPTSHADEKFSLHLDLGGAQPITIPQNNLYQTGLEMSARGLFNVRPYLLVGPSVTAVYLPKAIDDGSNAGVLWQFGGSVRLQRNHDIFNDSEYGVWSPYLNIDVSAAHTGNLWRPAVAFQVGEEIATDSRHSFWIGPYLSFDHVFQTATTQDNSLLDSRDVNLVTAGVSFTWDYPQRSRVLHQRVVETRVVRLPNSLLVQNQPREIAAPVPEKLEFTEHVYFDLNKATLRWESKDKLEAVVAKLNAHPNVAIHVSGHASSDGQKTHNEKLAVARAESVRQYLVSHGVDASRLTVNSFGVDRPAADNKNQEGRERSRRVEFEVTFSSK
jgi:outer membrane protein OmpA-like peptidoglycan-associated protein